MQHPTTRAESLDETIKKDREASEGETEVEGYRLNVIIPTEVK